MSAGRSPTGLALVWLVSVVPIALPELWAPLGTALGDASRAALAALPWIAWLGLPRPARRPGTIHARSSLADASLALPPIAAGLGVDVLRGAGLGPSALAALAALAMVALLAWASEIAAASPRRALLHGLAWLVIVPAAPLLRVTLELGGAPAFGRAPAWLAALAGASPLAWAWRVAIAGPDAATALGDAVGALGACLVLLALAGFPLGAGSASGAARAGGAP